ncbi:hypothetical protein [Streptomyces sp. CC228A]|uniref:hypothetical protein n=1 Tax=Streptomyces sp. CC228A TaxID=2898186 RepID=UPI001F2C3DB0|nr:hypothetical protein [Streptomyces sp. CC228A]
MTTPRRAARAARSVRAAETPAPPPRAEPVWRGKLSKAERDWPNGGPLGMPAEFMVVYASWRRWRRAVTAWRAGSADE